MRKLMCSLLCLMAFAVPAPAADDSSAMTGEDLQNICTDSSAQSKAACRFYILGITQGVNLGLSIADGKTKARRPCIPDDIQGSALELAVKMKLGQDLMVFPDDKKLDASGLIAGILVSLFPCHKTS